MDIEKWYETFTTDDKYVIWGCSDFAEQFINLFLPSDKLNIAYIVDVDTKKQGSKIFGVDVYSPDALLNDRKSKIIISNTYMGTRAKIKKSLDDMGFLVNVDYTYIEIAMSVFSWKLFGKIVSQYAEISTTTYCSLNCKNCTAYMPYISDRHHVNYDELARGIDAYFGVVDYVGRFRLLGGEPLVYPHIIELVNYVGEKYRERIGELCIVTNGTIDINDNLLQAIKQHKVTLFIPNYSDSGHRLTHKSRYDSLLTMLSDEKINYHFTDMQKWLELGNPNVSQADQFCNEYIMRRFSDCRHYCRSIVGDYLFMCATWAFAVLGNIYKDDWNNNIGDEIMDLVAIGNLPKEKRFEKWFSFDIEMQIQKGYLEFCKYCNGFGSLNENFVPVGEQAEGKLL